MFEDDCDFPASISFTSSMDKSKSEKAVSIIDIRSEKGDVDEKLLFGSSQ